MAVSETFKERFGILNHLGGFWTNDTFPSRELAEAHIRSTQKMNPTWKLDRHRVVPVNVTIAEVEE